jgi:signal transduction histidine kinase
MTSRTLTSAPPESPGLRATREISRLRSRARALATQTKRAEAALQARAAELALVSEVALALVGPLLPPEIATAFLRGVASVLRPEATAMFLLYDEDQKAFRSIAAEGPDAGDFLDYSMAVLPHELHTLLMDQREALLLPDTTQAAVWPDLTAALPYLATARSLYVVPLVSRDRLVGALFIRSGQPGALDERHVALLRLMGHYVAGALHSAQSVAVIEGANAQLLHLSKAKSDFVSIVSHEFRTPLTGIQGFSELIRDEDLQLEEIREFAGDINKDAQRLNRLITDMLDLDRMESGRISLHLQEVNLGTVITEAVAQLSPHGPNHPVRLELEPAMAAVTGDRDKLTQVVTNLLSNAVKYAPEGSEIAIRCHSAGGMACIAVQDHGMGIPPEALEEVFERYARLGSTQHIQGIGLGLPIVRLIAELHHGRVWAESILGEGSTFHVTVPFTGAALPAHRPAAAPLITHQADSRGA